MSRVIVFGEIPGFEEGHRWWVWIAGERQLPGQSKSGRYPGGVSLALDLIN